MQKRKTLNHNAELMEVLRFTRTDLEANRQAKLSPRQLNRIQKRIEAYRANKNTLGIFIKWATAFAALLIFLYIQFGIHEPAKSILEFALIMNMVILATVGIFYAYLRSELSQTSNPIYRYEGRIQIDPSPLIKSDHRLVLLEKNLKSISISHAAAITFKNNEPYEIYYTGKGILSAYWLNEVPFTSTD